MVETKEEIKQLYKDALYYHLLRKGYTIERAELEASRTFNK